MSKEVSTVTTQSQTVTALINQSKPAFQMALGSPKMADHFTRVALTLVRQTPLLAKCDGMTLLAALMQAAQLNLYLGVGLGQAYLIPYYSNKRGCYEAQFQIGYQGLIDLFYRHQLAKELYVETVHKNDHFKLKLGTERYIDHEPATSGDRGEVIGYYAVARLSSGASNFAYMTVADVERWRDHYAKADKSGKRGVWDTDFDAMAKKTCIKQVLKYMPKSIEMINIMEADESVKRPINELELRNLDIVPNRLEYDDQAAESTTDQPAVAEIVQEPKQPKPNTAAAASKVISERKISLHTFIGAYVPIEEQDGYRTVVNDAKTSEDLQVIETNLNTNFGGGE